MKIEISIGELVDKVTILEIKTKKMKSIDKVENVKKEYAILSKSMNSLGIDSTHEDYIELMSVNEKLWDIEDGIRAKESRSEFDDEFIKLARSVYFINDDRAAIKRKLNIDFNSELIEEKEYVEYKED